MTALRVHDGLNRTQTSSERHERSIYMQCCGQRQEMSTQQKLNTGQKIWWSTDANTHQTNLLTFPQSSGVDLPIYRSPESVEMDEIMAAMVLTSLSCSPVVQSPLQRDLLPGDMECCGGELSDSGSSGYWSWDHGNLSPAPSLSITEMDRSPSQPTDEGLPMELDQTKCEELKARRYRSLSRGAYRCLWPGCEKVLTSRVGMKRHIHSLHLGGASEQSHREEDFYYTEVSSEDEETEPSSPAPPFSSGAWTSCSSTQSQTTTGCQEAPGSMWQIHTEHLYQACSPIQVMISPGSPTSCSWTLSGDVHQKPQFPASRSRSGSVGEQWLQRNRAPIRPHTISASPARGHCSYRKARGEAKKCRKVYGVERRNQWCTACRWKKACQRFPD